MTKRRIAVAVAALFLGAQAGIAALEPEAASAVPAVAEQHAAEYQAARAEVTERAEPSAAAEHPEAAESAEASGASGTPEPSASAETAEAAAQPAPEVVAGAAPEIAAQRPPAASSPAAPEQPMSWWDRVRAAFASFFERVRTVMAMSSTTPAPTFPDGDGSSAWHLPATVAYLDQVEQERAAAIQTAATESAYPDGSGSVFSRLVSGLVLAAQSESAFPMGSNDTGWRDPVPAELAYYERLDRELLAREGSIQTAQADTETIR